MIAGIVRENFRDLLIVGGLIVAYYGATDAQPPSGVTVPEWWPLIAVAALLAAIGILFASGKIDDLLPESHGTYLYVINAQRTDVMELWELSEDQFADLETINGPLNHLPRCKHEAYEVLAYNPEENVAVGTWRQSLPASQLVGHTDVSDAQDKIDELRKFLEPEAKRGRFIRQNLPGLLRALDRERARNQARALEPQVAPSFGGESINDAIDAMLPDGLKPTHMAGNEDVEQVADEQGVAFEILDEPGDEPLAVDNGANDHEPEQ